MTLLAHALGLRRLGCQPDPHDRRDLTLASARLTPVAPVAASVDNSAVPIRNQGGTSSCVGFAWSTALRLAYIKRGRDPGDLSPLFAYFLSRAEHNAENADAGTQLRSAAKVIRRAGIAAEVDHPFSPWRVNRSPAWRAYRSAYDRRGLRGYYAIVGTTENCVAQVRSAIASGLPVVGGWDVDRALLEDGGPTVVGPMTGPSIGGHALCVTGYTSDGLFRVRNSWGSGWRDRGLCWFTPALLGQARTLWAVDVTP